jgi:hypothetical protein
MSSRKRLSSAAQSRQVRIERVDQRLDTLSITRARHEHRPLERVAFVPQAGVPQAIERPGEICRCALREPPVIALVHHDHVRDLHDAGLDELQDIARAGLNHETYRVDDVLYVRLGLSDAGRLHEHAIVGSSQHFDAGVRGLREPARFTRGRERAHEDARVFRIERHARAIPEQRTA